MVRKAPSASKQRTKRKTVAHRQTPLRKSQTAPAPTPPSGTKLDVLVALLRSRRGATVPEMMEATGWQSHSVRGALAGALKRRGHTISSEKSDGERRYRIEAGA